MPSGPIPHTKAGGKWLPQPPAYLARMIHAVMTAVGEEAGVNACEVGGNGDAERAWLTGVGAMPRRDMAGLGQVKIGRR